MGTCTCSYEPLQKYMLCFTMMKYTCKTIINKKKLIKCPNFRNVANTCKFMTYIKEAGMFYILLIFFLQINQPSIPCTV